MHRARLLEQLGAYHPADENERGMRDRLLEFVRENPDCFERSLKTGHVTGSAWIVDAGGRHVLLTHHHRLDKWMQLGGHADGDPNVLAVALREAWEESGLDDIRPLSEGIFDVDVHEIPARGGEPAHYHHDVRYLFEADRRRPLMVSRESKALAWAALEEIERFSVEESVLRMARKTRLLLPPA